MANVTEPRPHGKNGNGTTNGQYAADSNGTDARDNPKGEDQKQPTRPLSDELREVLDHYLPR